MICRSTVSLVLVVIMALSGCANIKARAPALGAADTDGFDTGGATVSVVYECNRCGGSQLESTGVDISDKAMENRYDEFVAVLESYGFRVLAAGNPTDYRVHVREGLQWRSPNSLGLQMLSVVTLFVLPAPWEETSKYEYQLLSGKTPIHDVSTNSIKQKLGGWVAFPLLITSGSVDRKARLDTHHSVIGLWIEQGSFDREAN